MGGTGFVWHYHRLHTPMKIQIGEEAVYDG